MSRVPSASSSPASLWRTGLYGLKPAFVASLRRVEDRLYQRGVRADTVTVAALAIAAVTALALVAGTRVPWLWLAVPLLCLARMGCNALDGALARRRGASSARGAVLNELSDRAADAVTFAALAPAVGVFLALAVVVVALCTSFVAVVGQAVVGQRVGAGPLGKPDRVAVLSVAAAVGAFAGPEALVVGSWVLVALGAITIARRTRVVWQHAGGAA